MRGLKSPDITQSFLILFQLILYVNLVLKTTLLLIGLGILNFCVCGVEYSYTGMCGEVCTRNMQHQSEKSLDRITTQILKFHRCTPRLASKIFLQQATLAIVAACCLGDRDKVRGLLRRTHFLVL